MSVSERERITEHKSMGVLLPSAALVQSWPERCGKVEVSPGEGREAPVIPKVPFHHGTLLGIANRADEHAVDSYKCHDRVKW